MFDYGKHHGKTFREVYLVDPGYCDWTVRQDRLLMWKSMCFKYFVRRVNDLDGKRIGNAQPARRDFGRVPAATYLCSWRRSGGNKTGKG